MDFMEQQKHVSATQVETRTWAATPSPDDTFLVTCIRLQDLVNMRKGTVNFFGDVKPKQGTLEELTDVYTAAWLYKDLAGNQRVRPLVGNFNGGFQTYNEARGICIDVWAKRGEYRTTLLKPSDRIITQ